MLTAFFLGTDRIRVPAASALTLARLLWETGAVSRDFDTNAEVAAVTVAHRACAPLLAALRAAGVEAEVTESAGLPRLFSRLSRRVGLWLGLCAAAGLILLSSGTIWEVRVSGCERLSERAVLDLLAGEGVAVGARTRGLVTDTIEANVVRASPDIAWMSVNLHGSVAFVEVREQNAPPAPGGSFPDADGINLVAAEDGVILHYVLSAGQPVPGIGSAVRKGDLLVSGILETPHRGLVVCRAAGEVAARVERTVSVRVPFEYEVSRPVGRRVCALGLIFFGFEEKFYKNYGNAPPTCDTIIVNKYIYNRGGRIIPVGLRTETVLLTETERRTRTAEEALALAYLELDRAAAAAVGSAETVSRTVTEEIGEDGVTLVCRIGCVGNIAAEAPIFIRTQKD